MTEEDVKARFIFPFLTSLGFGQDELSFEQSFSVRFGKNVARIDTGKQITEGHPRLDILAKRNNRNLFVVEVKTDDQDLTEDDRDQAVNYARLLDDMAPIAVVTNGKEFKLYKVGNKEEIEKNKECILKYRITADLELLYDEALQSFIGYSKENVRNFCRAQIKERMNTLMGSQEVPDRKFIPALFVGSKELRKAVNEFLESGKTAFAVVGESGKGKTCALCGLASELIEQYPTLFYRARELSGDLAKTMCDDFNWQFSTRLDEVSLLKRLHGLFKGETIIVLIDGLDEWTLADREEVLGNFARHVRSLGIRLIVSCKATQWGGFLAKDGTPTPFSLELFQKGRQSFGYFLKPLDDEEFHVLIRRYREFYAFNGRWQGCAIGDGL